MDIRQLYNPIQPAIGQSEEHVSYIEFLPDLRLQPYIYCYWELKTIRPLKTPFNYKVVSDGCIDILFELNEPHQNYVNGFCKKYTEFSLPNSFHYIGIRFLPTMFPQLFHISAHELTNRFESLDMVLPQTAQFIANSFSPLLERTKIKKLLDNHFLRLSSNALFKNDSRLYDAIHQILKSSGSLKLKTDLNTGISPRQLRRLFNFYIGDSAKTFSKVVRFQNILRTEPSAFTLKENKVYYDIGYYDQAHFIKEFKNCYGLTPGKAFQH